MQELQDNDQKFSLQEKEITLQPQEEEDPLDNSLIARLNRFLIGFLLSFLTGCLYRLLILFVILFIVFAVCIGVITFSGR